MAQEAEPDIAALLAQANQALLSANSNDNNFDINALQNDGPENIQLTAEDMNDPDLLAQLAEFGDDELNGLNNEDDIDDGDEKVFEEEHAKILHSIKQVLYIVFSIICHLSRPV